MILSGTGYPLFQTSLNLFVIFHLAQLIENPTPVNVKCSDKSTLLDLFLTNTPHKYTDIGVFAKDVSNHCVIAAVRDTKRLDPKFSIQETENILLNKHFIVICTLIQSDLQKCSEVSIDKYMLSLSIKYFSTSGRGRSSDVV